MKKFWKYTKKSYYLLILLATAITFILTVALGQAVIWKSGR